MTRESSDCDACGRALPFLFPRTTAASGDLSDGSLRLTNPVLRRAFVDGHGGRSGLPEVGGRSLEVAPLDESGIAVVRDAAQVYRRGAPSCLAVGVASGVRGGIFGAAIGGVMGASSAAQSGYRGSAALTYAGHSAIRNAAGFASWTALFASSRCGLVKLRRRDDILNSAAAGAFTGGALTLITLRGHWRYNTQIIATNAGGSALIAVVFGALGSF